ncbi:MAG: LPS biosynthesis protein WbpP, partial [Capnocytophaga sp.]|nr:LPS biosynthesis protein WbpP [Capnocytophaga sp.]
TTIKDMAELLKKYLSVYDAEIANIDIVHGPNRQGDVPHSLASIEKAQKNLGYQPTHVFAEGLKEAVDWYWKNLK